MNRKNKTACFGLILILFSAGLNLSALTLKMAVIVPEESVWGKKFKETADKISEATDGNVKLRIYFGGVQGDELKVIQKIRIGQIHGGGFMARGVSKICPDSLVFAIPMLLRSDEEAIYVHKKMEPLFDDQARKRGYEVLGWTGQGFTYCFSKDRVASIEELRQSKPWMLENDDFSKSFFKCSSISAIPAQVGDVMTALQSGMIRTVFAPPVGMLIMQWFSKVKYRQDLGLFYSFGAIVISEKQWKKIPEKYRSSVKTIFAKCADDLNLAIEKQNKDALRVLDKKLTVVKPTEKAIEEFRGVTVKVEQDMTDKAFSSEAIKLLKSYLKEYRDKKRDQDDNN